VTTPAVNSFGQPVGPPVSGWSTRPLPPRTPLEGRFCRLEPLDAEAHADGLFAAYAVAPDGRNWTYLSFEPFDRLAGYRAWAERYAATTDPLFHAVIDQATGKAVGVASYMRIDTTNGVIETGHLNFSPLLQRRPAATEAMFLMMQRVFDELGYRRYEWKCDSLNAPSRRAAERFGFTFEGVFRQAVVTKGRSRDTAWYAIIDTDWPALKSAYQAWLSPENFDASGRQHRKLADLIALSRAGRL